MLRRLAAVALPRLRTAAVRIARRRSSNAAVFPGASAPFTRTLGFRETHEPVPCFQVMDWDGSVYPELRDAVEGALSSDALLGVYREMNMVNVMDSVLYDAQRQGRISFYMTSSGEEATHLGTSLALLDKDVIYAQYREVGVLMHRGFTLDEVMNQCYGNYLDPAKGRQMPVHYGSKRANFQTISSPLATQIPQASGAGYALRLEGNGAICACYFGDGAASEGDFHAALNFAATTGAHTLFVCRNNGWAISTPTTDQYRGDAIAGRGPAYGIRTARVDGNDFFAVLLATRAARANIIEHGAPALLELMTYRRGHHSTSDDATRYRSADEMRRWLDEFNPIARLAKYLIARGLWRLEDQQDFEKELRDEVLSALARAEKLPKPRIADLFEEVYETMTPELARQKRELYAHLSKYGEHYPQHFMPDDAPKP